MIYKLIITDLAYADIEDIFQFGIETFGELVTEKFIDKLNDKIIAIKEMPGRGQLNEFLPKGLRFLKVDNHYIINEYSDSLKLIRILRIVHQHMDLSSIPLKDN